jgi:hypothetical protein
MSQQELQKLGDQREHSRDNSTDHVSLRMLDDVFKDLKPAAKAPEVSNQEIDRRVDNGNYPFELNEREKEQAKAIAKAAQAGDTKAIKEIIANAKTPEQIQEVKNAIAAAEQALAGTGISLSIEEGSRMRGNETEPHDFLQVTVSKDGHHVLISSDDMPDLKWDDQPQALEFPDIFGKPSAAEEAPKNRRIQIGDLDITVPQDWDPDPGFAGGRKSVDPEYILL